MALRLFAAFALPEALKKLLIGRMHGVEAARWQTAEQLHLTLRYFGEVSEDVAADIDDMIGNLDFAPAMLHVEGVGHFARGDRVSAIWAGVKPLEPLDQLFRKLDQGAQRIGLKPEGRRYVPHITMARLSASVREIEPFLSANQTLKTSPFRVDAITLFESRLSRAGSRYIPLAVYPANMR